MLPKSSNHTLKKKRSHVKKKKGVKCIYDRPPCTDISDAEKLHLPVTGTLLKMCTKEITINKKKKEKKNVHTHVVKFVLHGRTHTRTQTRYKKNKTKTKKAPKNMYSSKNVNTHNTDRYIPKRTWQKKVTNMHSAFSPRPLTPDPLP